MPRLRTAQVVRRKLRGRSVREGRMTPCPSGEIGGRRDYIMGYKSEVQNKNIAWYLPRPKPDKYKGGMPLYCEDWLIELAKDILGKKDIKILNAFCGMSKQGFRVDIKEDVKPDLVCDMHEVSQHLKDDFDVILADPPYSTEESKELYLTPPLHYKNWTNECDKLLKFGGLLIVYHKYIMPNPNPEKYSIVKRVFIGNRIYHLPRVAIYFCKNQKLHRRGRD